uniref:Uncharacterized protein n=1 Tax=Strongyloides papillosus TaxID=174720 RepID=A0A0N5BGJ1_STREA
MQDNHVVNLVGIYFLKINILLERLHHLMFSRKLTPIILLFVDRFLFLLHLKL